MPEEIQQLNNRIKVLEDRLNGITNDPRQVKVIQNALLGDSLTIKSLKTDKMGVGVAPVATQGDIDAPVGGGTVDAESRTAINAIRSVLVAFGLTN